jgi:hypothetical protein
MADRTCPPLRHLPGHPQISMTAAEVAALGPGLASRMSMDQLEAASVLFNSLSVSTTEQNSVSIADVRRVFMNHLSRCIRMPAGGATAGGSQQTGFEMELVTADCASRMFQGWPNRESSSDGRKMSWEFRSMETLADNLALQDQPAGWGALQGKPISIAPGRITNTGVLMVGPPFTVSWMSRPDRTTLLSVRFPLVVWTEDDAAILPPDDAAGTPFYINPPTQPGLHRDLFKTWGRRIAAELLMKNYPMSAKVLSLLPKEYLSDSDSDAPPATPRSVSPEPVDNSDMEADSSDMEGGRRPPTPDSSDLEGAHGTPPG